MTYLIICAVLRKNHAGKSVLFREYSIKFEEHSISELKLLENRTIFYCFTKFKFFLIALFKLFS